MFVFFIEVFELDITPRRVDDVRGSSCPSFLKVLAGVLFRQVPDPPSLHLEAGKGRHGLHGSGLLESRDGVDLPACTA